MGLGEMGGHRNLHVWNSHGHHAAQWFCECANFGGSVVHSMLLIYSPDGTNFTVQEVGSLKG